MQKIIEDHKINIEKVKNIFFFLVTTAVEDIIKQTTTKFCEY